MNFTNILTFTPTSIILVLLLFVIISYLVSKSRKLETLKTSNTYCKSNHINVCFIIVSWTAFICFLVYQFFNEITNWITPIVSGIVALFNASITIRHFILSKEHSNDGMIYFSEAEIKLTKNSKGNKDLRVSLIDRKPKTNNRHHIRPQKLKVFFYHNQTVVLNPKISALVDKNNEHLFYTKFDIDNKDITRDNTIVNDDELKFWFDFTDSENKLGNTFNRSFFADTEMLGIEIEGSLENNSKIPFFQYYNNQFSNKLLFEFQSYDGKSITYKYKRYIQER